MILPVLDLMAGRVVRGIAGRRQEYRPLEPTCDPLAVARTFRDRFGLSTLYVADLDAIARQTPALGLFETLVADGFVLWVDAGVRRVSDATTLVRSGVGRIIAGLETLDGPEELDGLVRTFGAGRIVFSLDLRGGEPLAAGEWPNRQPTGIADRAVGAGIESMILLDLTRVGVGQGIGTEEMLAACHHRWPTLELIAGGGIRDAADLTRLKTLGARHALVASALHDARLSAADVRGFS